MSILRRVTGQREFNSKYGPLVSVGLDFDEFQAELTTKPETLTARLEMLEANIGKDSDEWAFQDQGLWGDGKAKAKKVTGYPGKAPAPQGGGKRDYVPRYGDTREGFDAMQERMDRRTALMQAVAIGSGITTELAEKFYVWLRQSVSAGGSRGVLRDGEAANESVGGVRSRPTTHIPADTTSSESGINAPAAPAANTERRATPQPDSDTTSALEPGTVKGKDSAPGSGAAHKTSAECTDAGCEWKAAPKPDWLVSSCGNAKKASE